MTLGRAAAQGDLFDGASAFCGQRLADSSIYVFLRRERERLFPEEMFVDLFTDRGRRCVPPSVVATVMVLQRLEGLSDREAVERYAFDARWRFACGADGYGGQVWDSFAHTVLVDMRERLRRSRRPDRIFQVGLAAAAEAGLVGRRRVLDSTPLYDAVATMDTVTLIRSAVRGLLKVAGGDLEAELRGALGSGDDYASSAKPQIDWDEQAARDTLIDSAARDAFGVLGLLDGRELEADVDQAAALLATVVGQDLEEGTDGVFRIARKVAKDRIISTVDPEARHGHKTSARGFDGYKGHAAIDPDSELITATTVTPGNAGDGSVAGDLIADLLERSDPAGEQAAGTGPVEQAAGTAPAEPPAGQAGDGEPTGAQPPAGQAGDPDAEVEGTDAVYGDAAYGSGSFQDRLEKAGLRSGCKTQPPAARRGRFSKDCFGINLTDDTITCPAGRTVAIRRAADGTGTASFAPHCGTCPLRRQCTDSAGGRTVQVGVFEDVLARARARQADPNWQADYRATRPKVERKLAHLMRRKHGGRRARVRGTTKVDTDFRLLAAAVNLARLATLGLRATTAGWAVATP